MESPDPEWLKKPEGREWLLTDEGRAWLRAEEGWAWMHSPDAQKWLDELAKRGWDPFFRGEMPPAPEWAITPDVAPRIGDRIQLREAITSSNGAGSNGSEPMIVVGLDFSPIGIVRVEVRSMDGRVFTTITRDSYVAPI